MAKKKPEYYIDNAKFYEAISEYKIKCIEAEKKYRTENQIRQEDLDKKFKYPKDIYPRISEYVGECMFLIAVRLSNSRKFFMYSYKDEMISDGYEDCILRIRSFNHEKYNNPFAYFTQIAYFAFLRRIKKEHKQKTIKSEMILNSSAFDFFDSAQQNADDKEYTNNYLSFLLDNIDYIETDSEKEQSKRDIVKKTTKAYQLKLKQQKEEEEIQKERDEMIGAKDD